MLMPKRVKRRKQFRGTMAGKALRGNTISYGEYGLVAAEPCWIKSNQIEAARIAMTRYIKRGGKVWIKIFPDKPVTCLLYTSSRDMDSPEDLWLMVPNIIVMPAPMVPHLIPAVYSRVRRWQDTWEQNR